MTPMAAAFHRACRDLAGITFWLSDGSLLGAHRDGEVAGPDLDLGVWVEDLPRVRQALTARVVTRRPSQIKARYGATPVDIHGHHRDGDTVWYPLHRRQHLAYAYPARLFQVLTRVELYGLPALAPSPVEDYLVAHYGSDWATPRTGWRWDRDPPCLVEV